MEHTHTLLWSSFSSVKQVSLHLSTFFLLAGFAFRMTSMVMFFLPFAFTYLLVGADLVESEPRHSVAHNEQAVVETFRRLAAVYLLSPAVQMLLRSRPMSFCSGLFSCRPAPPMTC